MPMMPPLRVESMPVSELVPYAGNAKEHPEQLGRRAYIMELDPHYCDVIIARWEQSTGKTARIVTE